MESGRGNLNHTVIPAKAGIQLLSCLTIPGFPTRSGMTINRLLRCACDDK
jgi:hypothetical protein